MDIVKNVKDKKITSFKFDPILKSRIATIADFLSSILKVVGLGIFLISQATTGKKFWIKT